MLLRSRSATSGCGTARWRRSAASTSGWSSPPVGSAGCRKAWEPEPMTQPPMPGPAPRTRPPGPRLLTSFIVGGLGILLGIAAAIGIAIPLAGSVTAPRYAVPGALRLHLHDAKYTVYQFTGTRSVFGNSESIG